MTKITSREPEEPEATKTKVGGNRTNYAPAEMTDSSVAALASHYYTIAEVAAHFSVTEETVLAYHGDAFRKGKLNAKMKPRMLMQQFFNEVLARESLLGPEFVEVNGKTVIRDLDMHAVKGMIELHAKKYEQLGAKTEVTPSVTEEDATVQWKIEAPTAQLSDDELGDE